MHAIRSILGGIYYFFEAVCQFSTTVYGSDPLLPALREKTLAVLQR